VALPPFHDRQQPFDPLPQPVRHDPRQLLTLPYIKIGMGIT
jgi:hypothetical protein